MANNIQKTQLNLDSASAARRTQFFSQIKKAIAGASNPSAKEDLVHSFDLAYHYQPEPQNNQEREQTLISHLTSQSAEIHQLASKEDLPEKIASIMSQKSFGTDILIGENEFIRALNWPQNSPVNLKNYDGNNKGVINYTMTTALAAASETGTLFFASSKQNPAALNFLPTCHIALLDANTIFQTYEQVYEYGAKIDSNGKVGYQDESTKEDSASAFPPRSLNMISGPSRTADIEQALTLGAHGPIELIVLIYKSPYL